MAESTRVVCAEPLRPGVVRFHEERTKCTATRWVGPFLIDAIFDAMYQMKCAGLEPATVRANPRDVGELLEELRRDPGYRHIDRWDGKPFAFAGIDIIPDESLVAGRWVMETAKVTTSDATEFENVVAQSTGRGPPRTTPSPVSE